MKDEPAFPTGIDIDGGLTKREYFASKMAEGIWSNPESIVALLRVTGDGSDLDSAKGHEHVARIAVRAADALIAELEKK